MSMRSLAAVFCVLAAMGTGIAMAKPHAEIIAELGRDRIYQGESVLYRVTLNHIEDPTPPKLEGFDDFDITFRGERSLDSRQITIINGRTRSIIRRGKAYDYVLMPRRSGRLTVPAPQAEAGGRILTGNTLTLQVVMPESQDIAILELSSDRESVYLMQPFTITLNVAIKSLPAPVADRSPLEVQPDPPVLSIPWAEDDKLADGLEPKTPWRDWLSALQNRRDHGFSVNNVASNSAFSLFDRRPAAFLPQPRRTKRTITSGDEVGYWEYAFRRTFVAKTVGPFHFSPVTLKGTFATGIGTGQRLDGKDIFAVSEPTVVTVKDAPPDNRPDSYIGAVGQFEVTGSLNPKRTKVGDPMTMTLTLRGQGTLDRVTAPDLARIGPIRDQFKIYEATSETGDDTKRFTYGLRPRRAGIDAFPAVPIAYFDVDRERYITLRTEPIPIEVDAAEQLSDTDIEMAASPHATNAAVEVRQEGIFANITEPSALIDQSIEPGRWFLGFAGITTLFVAVALVARQVQRFRGDKESARRRAAAPRARRRLREALNHVEAQRFRHAADDVRAALVGLLADIAGLPEAGLTSADAQHHLATLGVGEGLVERLSILLEACDAARYGDSESAVLGLEEKAESLLKDLIKALKKKRV